MSKGTQVTFNGGEFTEFMDPRVDTDKYSKGCRRMENMMPLPYGAALTRPGTYRGGSAKYDDKVCRVHPFSFSTSISFDIEIGHEYFRFWKDQGRQLDGGGDILEVESPYQEEHLFELQMEQQNDVIYIVHPLYVPRRLTRIGNSNWTLTQIDFSGEQDYPPLMATNNKASEKIQVVGASSQVGATISLINDGFAFQAGDVGMRMMIGTRVKDTELKVQVSAVSTSAPVYALGDWVFQTQGIGVYKVKLEESDDKVTWRTRRSYDVDGAVNNILLTGSEETPMFFRIKISSFTSADPTTIPYVIIETVAAFVPGLVEITAHVPATDSAFATVIEPLDERYGTGFTTKLWALPYFSNRNGWPRAICFHKNRLILASNDVWCSEAGNFENFRTGNDASKGFMIAIRGNGSPIVNWLESLRELRVGCYQAEAVILPENISEPFGYNNYTLRWDSNYGSKYIRATPVNGTVFFIQPEGRTARFQLITGIEEFYDANSITTLADHIFADGVVQAAYQRQRYPTWYGVRTDGQLACLLFDQSQNIQAWYRMVTDGAFESISVTPRPDEEDAVCVSVKRIVGGTEKRFIEFFARGQYRTLQKEELSDMMFLDCAKTVTGDGLTEVTGLSYLEGCTVAILADGAAVADQVVTSGKITLDTPADKVTVGLPYEYYLAPMLLESQGVMGRAKSICAAVARLWRSGRAWARIDGGKWNRLNTVTTNLDDAPRLQTGDSDKFQMDSDWGRNTGIELKGRSPLPLNVQAITLEFTVGKG